MEIKIGIAEELAKPTTCPECGSLHEMAAALDDLEERPARPKDFVVCYDCQTVSIFDEDMILRMPTEAQIIGLSFTEIRRYQKTVTNIKALVAKSQEDEHE